MLSALGLPENMHVLLNYMPTTSVPSLKSFVRKVKEIYDLNVAQYIKIVIRRPLRGLMDFFDGVESVLKSGSPEEVSFHLNYSKAALKKVLDEYPKKELLKTVDALYKRAEKHFGAEDPQNALLTLMWQGIQQEYVSQVSRFQRLISLCYGDAQLAGLSIDREQLRTHFAEMK